MGELASRTQEQIGVLFKAILSQFVRTKNPGAAVDRDAFLKKEPRTYVIKGKNKTAKGQA